MSKRKRRRREEFRREDINNINNINTPFGINPNQLMSLLGNNIDFSQIGNVISSLNSDGLDLNNFNLNSSNNNQAGRNSFDLGPLQGFMNGLGLSGNNVSNNASDLSDGIEEDDSVNKVFKVEEVKDEHKNNFEERLEDEEEFLEEDENIQMLIAIKSIVDSKKADFLDRVIEEYNKGSFK